MLRILAAVDAARSGARATHRSVASAVALLILLSGTVDGQQRPTFQSQVARVRVDVIVRDADGRFVDDLSLDDFTVFEDGVRQEVLSAQLVEAAAGRIVDLPRDDAGPPETTDVAPRSPIVAPPAPRDLGAIIFLVDAAGLDGVSKLRFARAWQELVAETAELSLPRAAYMIDQQLRLRELVPLTSDTSRIAEAAQVVLDEPIARPRVRRRIVQLMANDLTAAHFEFGRSLYTFDVLAALASSLAGRGGRSALVWVSTGVSLLDHRPPRSRGPSRRIMARQRRFHRAANSANVAVYAVDPTSRDRIDFSRFDAARQTMPTGESVFAGRATISGWRDPLFNAAQETSGRSFVGWAEVGRALDEIRSDAGSYYLLTYALPEPIGDGDYHEIHVEVRRPGVQVRSRKGYTDHDPEGHRDRMLGAATTFPGLADGVAVRARAYRTWSEQREPVVILGVTIDPAALGTSRVETGGLVRSVKLQALVTDERANTVTELVDTVVAGETDGGAARRAPRAPAAAMHRRYRLDVENGLFDLRLAVIDEVTDRVGGVQLQIEVPDRDEGEWFVADPLLLVGERLVVDDRVPIGSTVVVYVEVFGGDQPRIHARLDRTGAARATTRASELSTPLRPASSGVHRGAVAFEMSTSGGHRLHLSIEDPEIDQRQSFDLPIEVIDAGARDG